MKALVIFWLYDLYWCHVSDQTSIGIKENQMLKNLLKNPRELLARKEAGQDLAEYSMFLGLIALIVVISITLIGTQISDIFVAIATGIVNGL